MRVDRQTDRKTNKQTYSPEYFVTLLGQNNNSFTFNTVTVSVTQYTDRLYV